MTLESFFDISFWKDFAANGLSTLLGVLFGIPVALWLNRKITERRQKAEQKESRLRTNVHRIRLLDMLEESLQKNQQLVKQMRQELTPQSVIFYNVDTHLLDGTSSIKYELIPDLDLNRLLDSIRYELGHLHRKVELQLEIEFSAFKAMQGYQAKRDALVGAIHGHFPRIDEEIGQALDAIAATKNLVAED